MVLGKILATKPFKFQKADGQGIAHDQLCRGTGSGGQIIGAGLLGYEGIEYKIRMLGQKRIQITRHPDQFVIASFDQRDQHLNFGGTATFGDTDDYVVFLNSSQVSVNGIPGVHKDCGGSRGVQGSGYFGSDNGTFAYSGNHNPPLGLDDTVHCTGKIIVEQRGQVSNGFALRFKSFFGQGKNGFVFAQIIGYNVDSIAKNALYLRVQNYVNLILWKPLGDS